MWTLQSLLDYCNYEGIDLFENCTTPAPIDNELLKSYIMKRCGLLEPVYGEPEVFKMQVKMWYDSNQWRMEHLVKMLLADYAPAENIFEHDHWEEKHTGTDTNGGKDTSTLSGNDSFVHGEAHTLSGTDTVTDSTANEHTVSAYNASTYQADNKDQRSGDIKTDYGKKDTASGTDTTNYGKVDTLTFGKTFTHGENIEYTRDRNGNVGVKSSSDLMQEELNLLERFNVYETLATWFEKENMIQVY